MAIKSLRTEIENFIKATSRPTRSQLSQNKLESYIFKKQFIEEWCEYCINLARIPVKPNTKAIMTRAFFIKLRSEIGKVSAPMSYDDKGDRVVISKLYKGTASFESSSSKIKPAVREAKRVAVMSLQKQGFSGSTDPMRDAMHGHHGGPESTDYKTTLGMVDVQDAMKGTNKAPLQRLEDEVNQQPKIDILADVVRSEFKDLLDLEMGWDRSSRSKTSVSRKPAKINVYNDIQISFALGHGVKGRDYTDAMADWDTPRGSRAGNKKLPNAIDDILAKVQQNVMNHIEKYVEKNPEKLGNVEGSPSVMDLIDAEAPKTIIQRMFPHKSNPDMRLKVNKALLKTLKIPTTKSGKVASKKAKGKVSGRRNRKRPPAVVTSRVEQKAGTNPMALKALINELLPRAVAQNMISPALQYRTGRFANSVRVDNITQGPRGGNKMIEASYMNNPYETFARGGKMYTSQRDPERLIRKSVRQVASGIIGAKFGIDIQ